MALLGFVKILNDYEPKNQFMLSKMMRAVFQSS
jgi:hypothetical protein